MQNTDFDGSAGIRGRSGRSPCQSGKRSQPRCRGSQTNTQPTQIPATQRKRFGWHSNSPPNCWRLTGAGHNRPARWDSKCRATVLRAGVQDYVRASAGSAFGECRTPSQRHPVLTSYADECAVATRLSRCGPWSKSTPLTCPRQLCVPTVTTGTGNSAESVSHPSVETRAGRAPPRPDDQQQRGTDHASAARARAA